MFFIDDLPIIKDAIKSFHPNAPSFDKEKVFYTQQRMLDWVTGAFFVMRKSVIERVGLFDEAMFMYAEEMEYCYRAKQAGFLCAYVPIAKIIHLGGKSSETKKTPVIGEMKNIKYFYTKHFSALSTGIAVVLMKTGALFRIVLFSILGRKGNVVIYAQAFNAI